MMNKNEITELAEKARQGNKTAFEKLYKEFYPKLYYFVKQNVSAPDAAEDITAETFCSAMEHINELHSSESFVGWLYCIAYHKCMDYNKKTALDRKCLAALLFSGVLLCAVVCCALLMLRQTFNRKIELMYDTIGHFEFMTTADRQDLIAAFTGDDTVTGKMDVMGTMGIGNMKFEYGILDDPHNLSHIPLEAGHMPREKGEIMIDRGVLDKLGFFGGVGDTIELDKGKYTIVGVTAKDKSSGRSIYGYRQGSVLKQLENSESNYYASDDDKKISEHNIPLIFISEKENQEPLYTWVMLYNIRGIDHNTTDKDKIYSLNINKHLQKEGLPSIPAGNFPLFERVLDTV